MSNRSLLKKFTRQTLILSAGLITGAGMLTMMNNVTPHQLNTQLEQLLKIQPVYARMNEMDTRRLKGKSSR